MLWAQASTSSSSSRGSASSPVSSWRTASITSTICVFFFKAEDGIRDHCVTGVQTCALPIFELIDTSRSCSSARAPLIAPSRLVSINSKSKTATDCATVGPQLTNNKAHNVTRYDGMIMVVYLGQVLALACSFVAPRACAVAAFVRPWLRTAQSGRHLAIVDALLVARLAAQPLFGGSRRLCLGLVRLAVPARSHRHLRCEYHCPPSNRSSPHRRRQHRPSIQQQSGPCCRF